MAEHLDVLVVGAGISGIGAAYYLKNRCPERTFAVLEGRPNIGGTWDLFRYPGIRSDSEMYTLGYAFHPWTADKSIAKAPLILDYLNDTIDTYGIRPHIRYQHKVISASFSTPDARWTVQIANGESGETIEITCNFLFMCSGYYNYDEGHCPDFPGRDDFAGQVVHPQFWPDDIDYTGKKVVVIGSGATAVTLIPELAKKARKVTMLQRSPTYIVAGPSEDKIALWLRDRLPKKTAYRLSRWRNVLVHQFFFTLARRAPKFARKQIREGQLPYLPDDFDFSHLDPQYNPWDQRICLTPDADFFDAIKDGVAEIVTDTIETFTETGLKLTSGTDLEADLIVTATGLKLQFLAGVPLVVDGEAIKLSDLLTYKAMMFSGVPNMALSFGYTNASWTLKSDLTGEYVCRLLNHMKRKGYRVCVPENHDPSVNDTPFLDFTSGYITRALADMPKQGSKAPWKMYQNYPLDLLMIRYGRIDDKAMQFS